MYYAQLDYENICRSISWLGKVKDTTNLILLDCLDNDKLDRKYDNNQWSEEKYPIIPTTVAPEAITLDEVRLHKLKEIGDMCTIAIFAGVEVDGKRYSLTEHDQIELMAQQAAVQTGATAVPYHADGELCRMYPADEFIVIANAATAHIFYHRTYCNHLNAWVRRVETVEELAVITYGTELPDDLNENMAMLIGGMNGA